jgi:hypothetical protein
MIRMRHEAEADTAALCAGKADCPNTVEGDEVYCIGCGNAVATWIRQGSVRGS